VEGFNWFVPVNLVFHQLGVQALVEGPVGLVQSVDKFLDLFFVFRLQTIVLLHLERAFGTGNKDLPNASCFLFVEVLLVTVEVIDVFRHGAGQVLGAPGHLALSRDVEAREAKFLLLTRASRHKFDQRVAE